MGPGRGSEERILSASTGFELWPSVVHPRYFIY
jgi:hypothetical protein